jgi:RNA polymerase sigma-70 factor, ECF subfamily
VTSEDAELVRLTVAGDQEAYRALVGRYGERAQRWARDYVKDASRAEEIVQEALLEAYFQLENLRRPERFGGWLRGIVVHTAISAFRKRRSAAVAEVSAAADGVHFHSRYEVSTPHDEVEEEEERGLVRAALRRLSPEHREVLTLFYFEEYTYEGLASRLHRSVAAIKSLLHRAREQLKKEITRHGR